MQRSLDWSAIASKEDIERMYLVENKTMEQVSDILGVHPDTLKAQMDRLGIDRRGKRQNIKLSNVQKVVNFLNYEIKLRGTNKREDYSFRKMEKQLGIGHKALNGYFKSGLLPLV